MTSSLDPAERHLLAVHVAEVEDAVSSLKQFIFHLTKEPEENDASESKANRQEVQSSRG